MSTPVTRISFENFSFVLLEQCQHVLRDSIRLSEHRNTRLLENLRLSEIRSLSCEVCILDS